MNIKIPNIDDYDLYSNYRRGYGNSIHLVTKNENKTLCNRPKAKKWTKLNKIQPNQESLLCRQCLNNIIKNNIPKNSPQKKNKRLEAYRKALSAKPDEFSGNNKKTITLPSILGPEEECIKETIKASLPVLTTIRQNAVMNMERIMKEWQKLPPEENELPLLQKAKEIKTLIKAIDTIKNIPL